MTLEVELRSKDGSIVSCEATNLPLLSEDKEIVGFIGVTRDIRERKKFEAQMIKAKEAAEQANRSKSEFLANMSHEFRTPLNHIIGFTEIVVDKLFGDLNKQQEEYLNDALSSSKHLLSLINDVLDISKIEAGKQSLKLEKLNLISQLDNCLKMLREKTLKKNIGVHFENNGCPKHVWADETKFKQILYNILSNAEKFTPRGGQIKITVDCLIRSNGKLIKKDEQLMEAKVDGGDVTENDDSFIGISIQDSGIGISGENLKRVFQPFEQVENSISRKYQGTGLGLALVKEFVELHGGKIWAESPGLDKGCTFTFILPN
jgi:signal transduction histidine kinase